MAAFGGTPQPSTSSQSTTTEHTVRVPNNCKKKYSMIKFSTGSDIDFLKQTTVKMERENNLKEYKSAYDIDTMPKFGAGSEYGREQKEEARRKKYGINIKKYNPDDQPWIMKVGTGKTAKRFKGVREGTITDNTSYYIFTQCADDAFEAFPIEEWYNFQPMIRYKYLNADEAEEEFNKRDRIMNKWTVMARKRIKNEAETEDPDDGEKAKSKAKGKKDKSLILTDMDDWGESDDDDDDEGGDGDDEDGEGKKPKEKGKKDKKPVKKKRNAKLNDQEEAVEESDEGDFDDRELDYITDSGERRWLEAPRLACSFAGCVVQCLVDMNVTSAILTCDDELDEKEKEEKYDDKGVDQEDGLKKLIDSEEESSEEEKNEEENEEEETAEKEEEKKKKEGEESESSSSSSGSDSEIEKDEKISSVLFMQKKKSSSRSSTPTIPEDKEKQVLKRKLEADESGTKKPRTESPLTTGPPISSGGITEETIRRYLMRKPMTAKELVQKFKSKLPQMTKEQMTQKIGQVLKKINPDRKYVNNILYLSVKKTD